MNNKQIAINFIEKYHSNNKNSKSYYDEYHAFSEEIKNELIFIYYNNKRIHIEKIFENASFKETKEIKSTFGKYKLTIHSVFTSSKSWNYTKGIVYNENTGNILFEINRNYSSFPFLFIENHSNGHDYLICGEDYQGQTVLELDTGKRKDFIPNAAFLGHGFCWSQVKFNNEHNILIVDGCYWACPYEFKFFDFSEPMNGWKEIEPETDLYSSKKWPSFESDGTIKYYQISFEDEGSDEIDLETINPLAIATYKRDGFKLVIVNDWVSEKELEIRADREIRSKQWEEWFSNFKANDPLYLSFNKLINDPLFNPDDFISTGITHEDWCPDFKIKETRICKRILKTDTHTIDFEWAAKTGPIKLIFYKNGNTFETKFFMEHSVQNIENAISVCKDFLKQII